MTTSFDLDSRLSQNGVQLFENSRYLLHLANDNRYVWLILIPKIANVIELHELPPDVQTDIALKSNQLAAMLKNNFAADKINTATIGNIVSQLHIHIVARNEKDAAWPAPIWGHGTPVPYSADQLNARKGELHPLLQKLTWT